MTSKVMPMRKYPFGLNSRTWGAFGVHENVLYGAVYGGGIYRINADGSDTLVVNQNRNWYAMFSAFGKLFLLTNSASSSGLYEVNPYTGTDVLRYSLNNGYCGTQLGQLLYISGVTGNIRKVDPLTWSATTHANAEAYRTICPTLDGKKLKASAARAFGNYGGLLYEYNPNDWTSTTSGSDVSRNSMFPQENSYLFCLGDSSSRPWPHATGGIFGSAERPLCTGNEALVGVYVMVPYNDAFYASGWPDKIQRYSNYARKPLGSKLLPAVGAPQRNFNYGLCFTPDGIGVSSVFDYTTTSILTSVDAGETWTTRTTPDAIVPMQVIVVPLSGSVGYRLVCVGEGGIMTSDDRGVTWTTRSTGNNFSGVCRDSSDSALYACGYSGTWGYSATSLIYKSTDDGVTWTSNYTASSGGMIQGITYDSTNARLVAVTFYGSNQVYTSSNHGTSWVANNTIQKQYWRGVLFDVRRGLVFAWTASLGDGSAYVMRSADGGLTWTYDSVAFGFNDMLVEPGGRMLGCRLNSIYASDNSVDFFELPGVAAGAWAKLAYSTYHDCVAACAVSGTARFMTSLSGRATPRRIRWQYSTAPSRAFNQGLLGTPSGRIIATATEYSTTSVQYSDDAGLTWNSATTSSAVAPMSVIQVPHSNAIGYRLVATCETAPGLNPAMYSDDNGVTWTLSNLSGIRGVIHLCRDHSTGYLFAVGYAGSDTSDSATTEILRSTDNGVTWTSVYTNIGGGLGIRIAYDPLRNRLCAITRNGSVHSIVSSDSGVTWTPYAGSATRPWRDMIWDTARGCLVKVCHEATRTSTVLGESYKSIIGPDGKEWLAEHLRWTGDGVWWNNGGSNDGDGRYYSIAQMNASVKPALTDGWRVPPIAELQALAAALGGQPVAGGKLKTTGTTYWNTPNTGATDVYGFAWRGAGIAFSGPIWQGKNTASRIWSSEAGVGNIAGWAGPNHDSSALEISLDVYAPIHQCLGSIRLVRDYTPTSEHMYRSFDGGITWSPVPGTRPAYCIVADRCGRLFTAGIGVGQRSTDGTTWTDIFNDANSAWRKLALLERYDSVIGIANAGTDRFLVTGNR